MFNIDQTIPCPVCSNKIHFDTNQLIRGMQFVCTNCQAAIGLATESQGIVQEAMQKLEASRTQAA